MNSPSAFLPAPAGTAVTGSAACILPVVGIRYSEVKECQEEFFSEARRGIQRRSLTLLPDKENYFDPSAIMVYDWKGRKVGYVGRDAKDEGWWQLNATKEGHLRCRVYDVDEQHHCVRVIAVASQPPAADPSEADLRRLQEVEDWSYKGPCPPMPKDFARLDAAVCALEDLLPGYASLLPEEREEVLYYAQQLPDWSAIDLSREMRLCRHRLPTLLEATGCDDLIRQAGLLSRTTARQGGDLGRTDTHGPILDFWWKQADRLRALTEEYAFHDYRQTERELEAFPGGLYNRCRRSPEHLAALLACADLPRRQLWQFFCGCCFVWEAQRREASAAPRPELRELPFFGESSALGESPFFGESPSLGESSLSGKFPVSEIPPVSEGAPVAIGFSVSEESPAPGANLSVAKGYKTHLMRLFSLLCRAGFVIGTRADGSPMNNEEMVRELMHRCVGTPYTQLRNIRQQLQGKKMFTTEEEGDLLLERLERILLTKDGEDDEREGILQALGLLRRCLGGRQSSAAGGPGPATVLPDSPIPLKIPPTT